MKLLLLIFCFCTSILFASDIAVVTLAVGENYKNVVQPGIENKQHYCQQHGYDFICEHEHLDPSRPIPWSKIVLIQQLMERNPQYKWIFWTDADSLITNQAIPLEDLIDDSYSFILVKDINALNTGQFLIKNCSWSHEFLEKVYGHTECIDHCWWENMAVINEIDSNPSHWSQIKVLPQRLIK